MYKRNILHVVTVSFSIPIFFRNQFKYFDNKQNTFLACKDSIQFRDLSVSYNYHPIPIKIDRRIAPIKDILCLINLYLHIKNKNIDIVVGHTPKAALLAMIASYFAKTKKRVYFKHGLIFETQSGFKKFILITIEKITEYFATEIICVSDSLLKASLNYKLGNPKKYTILNKGTCNGVDSINIFNPEFFQSKSKKELKNNYNIPIDDIVVGFIGRLANDKGIKELILAWEIIEKKYENISLLLIGPIDERDPFILVNQDSFKKIIRIDYVTNPAAFYSILDIFILPSYREGFPTVNLEASSMKLPVITTRKTGCINSIIEYNTGIFTDISPIAIFEAIDFYIKNPDIRKDHGENGRNFVINNYNQSIVWGALSNIYFS